jgi:hypothetical protein
MIAHQAVSMHLPIGLLARLGQCFQKILSIHVVEENILPAISPAHYVIHRSGIFDAQIAWHAL